MRVGFVCEGKTDFPVLQAVVGAVLGVDYEANLVQPRQDKLVHRWDTEGGCGAVQTWCQRYGPNLKFWLSGNSFDLMVVHIDADRCAANQAADTAALCAVIKGWLGDGSRCAALVVVIPAQASEAWLYAAHLFAQRKPISPHLEREAHPEQLLLRANLLSGDRSGRALKDRVQYEELARALRQHALALTDFIPELDRFIRKLRSAIATG